MSGPSSSSVTVTDATITVVEEAGLFEQSCCCCCCFRRCCCSTLLAAQGVQRSKSHRKQLSLLVPSLDAKAEEEERRGQKGSSHMN